MASDAGRTVQAVVIVNVAVSAGSRWHCVHPRQSETCAGVVEGGVYPVGGVVAGIASLREVRRDVVGIRRPLVVL